MGVDKWAAFCAAIAANHLTLPTTGVCSTRQGFAAVVQPEFAARCR